MSRVRPSIDTEAAKTLVHAFMTSRVDYCNVVLAGATKAITDKLQRMLNAAARLITGTRKFGKFDRGLSQLLHSDLHWLDVPQRAQYKLRVTMHRCLQHKAPWYQVDCCTSVVEVPGRRHLRSANRQQLLVPRYRRSALVPRAFFLSLARGLGMHFQTFSGILRAAVTISARHSRHSYSLNTDCM